MKVFYLLSSALLLGHPVRASELYSRSVFKMCSLNNQSSQKVRLTQSSRGYEIRWPNGIVQNFRTTHYHILGSRQNTRMHDERGEIWWDMNGRGYMLISKESSKSEIKCTGLPL